MTKEIVSLRKEIKYTIPLEKALMVKQRLDGLMARDSHCADGFYMVRSVYFESVHDTDFAQKLSGVSVRKKVRLRIYDDDTSLCKLEIKQKNGDWQQKHSFIIERADAEALSRGNYGVLQYYFDSTKTGIEAYSIMVQGCYRPVVQIAYDRIAYRYPMYDTRVTLDMNIRASESNLDIFSREVNYTPIQYENVVLEIKYSGKLMGFISDTLAQFDLTQGAYSKYCSGRKVHYDFNY